MFFGDDNTTTPIKKTPAGKRRLKGWFADEFKTITPIPNVEFVGETPPHFAKYKHTSNHKATTSRKKHHTRPKKTRRATATYSLAKLFETPSPHPRRNTVQVAKRQGCVGNKVREGISGRCVKPCTLKQDRVNHKCLKKCTAKQHRNVNHRCVKNKKNDK